MQDPFNPAVPAGAYDDLLKRVLPQALNQKPWEPADGPLPSLFVSHGAPPTLDDPEWLNDLFVWSQSMPKPHAIVIVSAHWENAPLSISSSEAGTPLVYDFGGFHPRYYTLQYSTPDASALAQRIAASVGDTTTVHQYVNRGLDHGAFIPLMAMYPGADVPVVQVSMPSLEPETLLKLGQRLKQLREEGVLIIGSGFMTHSFAVMRRPELAGYTAAFDEWANHALQIGDVDSLIDYQNKGPGAQIAHPTADHFVPLLLTLGAATNPESAAQTVIDRTRFGNSIRSLQIA